MPTPSISRQVATVAFSPPPPAGTGYLIESCSPRTVRRSPYAQFLRWCEAPNDSVLVWHREDNPIPDSLTARPDLTPTVYRPLPPPFTLQTEPIPAPTPDSNGSALAIEAASPSGVRFRLPGSTANAAYYRRRYPQAEILQRRGHLYATFPGDSPPQLPPDYYRELPRDGRESPYPQPDPGTINVYPFTYSPTRHIPRPYRERTFPDHNAPTRRYFSAENPPPETLTPYILQFAHTVTYHPDDPAPTFPDRYAPLHVRPIQPISEQLQTGT